MRCTRQRGYIGPGSGSVHNTNHNSGNIARLAVLWSACRLSCLDVPKAYIRLGAEQRESVGRAAECASVATAEHDGGWPCKTGRRVGMAGAHQAAKRGRANGQGDVEETDGTRGSRSNDLGGATAVRVHNCVSTRSSRHDRPTRYKRQVVAFSLLLLSHPLFPIPLRPPSICLPLF